MALQRRSRASVATRARERGALAAVLAARRQELGLTQTELAELAGVARGPVVAAESGRSVSLEVLLALVQVLGLHLELARGSSKREVEISAELAAHFALDDGAERRDE